MAVKKRPLNEVCNHQNERNVRPRLYSDLFHSNPAEEVSSPPIYTPILKKRKWLRYTKFPCSFSPNKMTPTNMATSSSTEENYCNGTTNSNQYGRHSNNSNRIRFHNKVFVVRIPSRDQYPESIKKCMWSPIHEIRENARRNTIEFGHDGWNWRLATEDEAMYVAPNGERIHPAHVLQPYPHPHQQHHEEVVHVVEEDASSSQVPVSAISI